MQIVRDLAGYSYGRSDLVRRAMSKKKTAVMEKERKNFVYGSGEEGEEKILGCIKNGISEQVANRIFDEMIDFAKYAFNKSHAAAYAVISYQTAYLKCYYPVEYMAALLTSVMTNVNKISEYIYNCRQMGIQILPPDINEGQGNFSVSGYAIRYGLSAIKGLGAPVIDAVILERQANGKYVSIKDFIERLSGKEVNKRTVESFIKSGSMDSLPGTRRQKMDIYVPILENIHQDRKKNLEGQLSLFDIAPEEAKEDYEIKMPDVGEYQKEELLAFEKEMLGIYISGHPMEEYKNIWEKNITRTTRDFLIDEETQIVKVIEGETAIVGGMISSKTIKTTRTNSIMAFIGLEDLIGSMEVIIFPKDYERNKAFLIQDSKVFIRGKVKIEEDKPAKLIGQEIIPFDKVKILKELWIRFPNRDKFINNKKELLTILDKYIGNDKVCIFYEQEKKVNYLLKKVRIEKDLIERLELSYKKENIKVVEKSIEKGKKID